ncbi:MAG: biosynthetic-type acetolactate synthase large subunit [Candidatus Methanomethylophilaceae archaeon]|nr:biosynthetic-type acetolactate synthase large subunit [Candidatus Methanomethylophilaceae archaeon]
MKGTKALVALLEQKNVDTIFGYPGGSVIPIYDALYDSSLRHILVRHEQCAAHMADGYARASGIPGVCLATSGPGTTNLVTGVATAYADSVPMIVLSGQVGPGSLGLGAFQEVDAYSLLMPITKHNFRVLDVNRLPHAVKEAWDICQSGRPGPVHIDLPVDQMNSDMDESLLQQSYGVKPDAEDFSGLDKAAEWIMKAERPAILAGGGAVNASAEVNELARLMRAPVAVTLLGLGIVPSSYELNMGPLGMHGRVCAKDIVNEADLVISVGSRFSDRTYSRSSRMQCPDGKVIHIDADHTEFGKHGHPQCVNLLGDSKKAVSLLLGKLKGYVPGRAWPERAAELRRRCGCCTDLDSVPVAPQKVMFEIQKIIKDDTIVTTDVGQNQMWAMHYLNFEHPRRLLSSGTFGTMGYGLPAAIGAKAARPDSDVITVTGDGGFQMVMQEMATSVSEDLPVTVVLLDNGTLGMVRQWQKLFWNKRYSSTTLDHNPDFVKLAEAFGAKGIRVERPGEISDALKEARDCGRTCLIDVIINKEEDVLPMLPADPSAPMVEGRCRYLAGERRCFRKTRFSEG